MWLSDWIDGECGTGSPQQAACLCIWRNRFQTHNNRQRITSSGRSVGRTQCYTVRTCTHTNSRFTQSESGRTKVRKRAPSELIAPASPFIPFNRMQMIQSYSFSITFSRFFSASSLLLFRHPDRYCHNVCIRFMPKFITETESLLIICIGAAYLVRCSSSAYFALLLPFTLPHSLEYLMPLPLPLPLHHGYHTAREGERVREKWAIESMRNTIQFRIWCTADIHLSIDVMTTWIATAESTVISFVVDFSLHDAQANGPSKKSIEIIFARKLKEAFPATVNDSTYVSIDPRRKREKKKSWNYSNRRWEIDSNYIFGIFGVIETEDMKSMKRNIWLIFIVIRHSRWWIDCERRAIASNNNYEKRTFLHVLSFFFRQINVSRVADSTDRDEPAERQTNATSEPKIMMVAMPNINSDAEERGASLEWVENGRWLWLVCVFEADAHSSWTAVWQTGELNDGHEFSKCRCEKNEQQQQQQREKIALQCVSAPNDSPHFISISVSVLVIVWPHLLC